MILAHLPVVVTFVVVAEKQKETFTMKQHLLTLIAKCLLNVPTYECCVIIGWPLATEFSKWYLNSLHVLERSYTRCTC